MAFAVVLLGLGMQASPVWAERLKSIFLLRGLLLRAGTETLVARDCPQQLMGAFVFARNAVVLCANNLKDDPERVWETLAHESAHVMQHCRREPIFESDRLGLDFLVAHRRSPDLFKAVGQYHPSQHRSEIEARIVQGLPAEEVMNLFRRACADRLL
ncbi:mitochondrial inner membrane protease ATP23 [Synechococcus sp. A10-1-5-1]|nr:mitochondrial inner membrane protease ATP23 [Synechococcus sp. A10-1-5-1]UPM49901.1 mitochondrial inner membrane protease ATP23 [Synechococcus sp. A10-1-5-1]